MMSTIGFRATLTAPIQSAIVEDVDLDAFAGEGTALAMQRQVQAELAESDLGQQHRSGPSPRDRM